MAGVMKEEKDKVTLCSSPATNAAALNSAAARLRLGCISSLLAGHQDHAPSSDAARLCLDRPLVHHAMLNKYANNINSSLIHREM